MSTEEVIGVFVSIVCVGLNGSSITIPGSTSPAGRRIWQRTSQPLSYAPFREPASQLSAGRSTMPSPHLLTEQFVLHVALDVSAFFMPLSHCSPMSRRPLPQNGGKLATCVAVRQ